MYPSQLKFYKDYFDTVMGSARIRKAIEKGTDILKIIESYSEELIAFYEMRKPYLIY
jgi:uncharacterized protein YbbC (DUF1343 family)